ncbi:unnamed protein product, partial [marine sediment metagenome]
WLDAAYDTGESFAPVTTTDPVGNFASIQAGVNASNPEGTVNVAPGTYPGDIRISKALTVRSTGGAEQTIIDGTGSYIVTISHSDVTFQGFTVTNPEYQGGADATGILIQNATESVNNVQILNNIVTQVRSETGTPSGFGATGVNVGTGPVSSIVISGNTITDIKNPVEKTESSRSDHTCGINVWAGGENITISNNTISDIKYNGTIEDLDGVVGKVVEVDRHIRWSAVAE